MTALLLHNVTGDIITLLRPTAAGKQNMGMVMEITHTALQVRVLRYHPGALKDSVL
jgi:hypothetical protein